METPKADGTVLTNPNLEICMTLVAASSRINKTFPTPEGGNPNTVFSGTAHRSQFQLQELVDLFSVDPLTEPCVRNICLVPGLCPDHAKFAITTRGSDKIGKTDANGLTQAFVTDKQENYYLHAINNKIKKLDN